MKIILLLLTAGFLQVSASTYAQKVTLKVKNSTIKEVFESIQSQTNYDFLYSTADLALAKPISLTLENVSLKQALDKCFSNQPLTYTIENTTILIKRVGPIIQQAPEIIITGKVTDEKDQPLPGVGIKIKNGQLAVVTDVNGVYRIAVPDQSAVLVFSYIGFEAKDVPVLNNTVLNVTLVQQDTGLQEVVVVGYGTQKKSDITGSVASLNMKRLESMPQVNIIDALQGTIAGLNASTTTNSAEGGHSISIRGTRSFAGGNDPLIILDGIPYLYSLSEIDPESVASIEVLKDASSAAIYGARAANGVILITTKKGSKNEKTQITYKQNYGIENVASLPDMMDPETFYRRKLERFGTMDAFTASELAIYNNGTPTDWLDEVSRQGTRADYNLSLSGGSNTATYFIAGAFNNVKGITKGDNFKRYNLQTNLEFEVNKWIKMGTNTQLAYLDRSGLPATWGDAFRMNPFTTPFNDDGTQKFYPWPEDNGFTNPLNDTYKQNEEIGRSIITNNYLLFNIPHVEGLTYKINTGYTYRGALSQTFSDRINTLEGFKNDGYATTNDTKRENWIIEHIVDYKASYKKHNLFLTALYSAQQYTENAYATTAYGFPTDVMTYYQPDNAATTQITANYSRNSHESQMMRLNYNYDSKYLLTLTARRDGYSAFGEDRKYGIFPSVALGWNMHLENFIKAIPAISNLKLRASYGENGNEGIAAYSTLAQLTSLDYSDGSGHNLTGYYPNRLSNPDLGWETTKQFNGGVDFGLFKNRLQGSIDVYASKTYDLLLSKSIPSVNGTTSILQNIGETKGRGIEIQLSSVNITNRNFKWTTNLNFESNKNEIVNVGLYDAFGKPIDDVGSRRFIGKPIDVNYNYVFDGIWQTNEVDNVNLADWAASAAGDIKYKDIDGDGKITPLDRTTIGKTNPTYTLGVYNELSYKNLTLSFFVYTSQGITKSNPLFTTDDWDFRRRMYNFNFWSERNPTNDYPANSSRERNSLRIPFYEDASFIRLKDVSLAYKFPSRLLSKIGIEQLEFFANAKNLLTITDWKGLDPEFDDQVNIAPTKIYLLGLKLHL